MTDKERLEEIKKKYFMYENYTGKVIMYHHVLEWLIEQAERVQELESFKNSVEYTVDSETLELIINNQDNDKVLSLSETYDEKIYLLQKRVQELEEERSEWKGKYSILKNKYRALQRKMKNRWRYNRALENESRTNEIVLEEFRELNKRYRKALEEIRDRGTYELNNAMKTDYAWIANEALEGEE